MPTGDSDTTAFNVLSKIAELVRQDRKGHKMTVKEYAVHLGSGTSVDIVKKVEAGPSSAPATSGAGSWKAFFAVPGVEELVCSLPDSSTVQEPSHKSVVIASTGELTQQMLELITSSALVGAIIDLTAPEFVPELLEVSGLVVDAQIEINGISLANRNRTGVSQFCLRLQHQGRGLFDGAVFSTMGLAVGNALFAFPEEQHGFAGTVTTFLLRRGHSIHALGLAPSKAGAIDCARTIWDGLATTSGSVLDTEFAVKGIEEHTNDLPNRIIDRNDES